jgi:hypothetical protein
MTANNSLLTDHLVKESNGVFKSESGAIQIGVGAGIVGWLLCGAVGILTAKQGHLLSGASAIFLLMSLGSAFVIAHILRLSGRTLQMTNDEISLGDKRGNELSSLRWSELARVSERRKMAQLALWDNPGTRRLLVDQQFENFSLIRSRILSEYAKVFAMKPLPIELGSSSPLSFERILLALGVALLSWVSWRAFQQGQVAGAVICSVFAILALLSLLTLFPRIAGASLLLEDRIVLRSLFKTDEVFKKDVASVGLADVTNSRSGTKFSLVVLKVAGGKELKMTAKYGDIPEIYLTLRSWLSARQ